MRAQIVEMFRVVACSSLCALSACAHGTNSPDPSLPARSVAGSLPSSSAEATAVGFLEDLARKDWAAAASRFDGEMARAMPVSRLAEFWNHLLGTQGDWIGADRYATAPKESYAVVLVDARFARKRQRLRVTVNSQGRISGLFHGPVPEDVEDEARAIVSALARGDGERAARSFNSVMRAALPPAGAVAAWSAVVAKAGTFMNVDDVTFQEERGSSVVLLRCRMQQEPVVTRVVFDVDGDVAGLFFKSASTRQSGYVPPPYADPGALVERAVDVGSAPVLPSTLTVPKDAKSVPGVVLVHGSGPQDRDETVGGTSIFRDLALGLATHGIAVLRYDKRTRVDPRGVVTQKEEVVDGALAAIASLRAVQEVDPRRVVVLGHSQGGSLAPRIAREDGRVAGIVILAGPTRPLQDSLIAQLRYLLSIDPANSKVRGLLDQAAQFKRVVEDPGLRADSEVTVPGDGRVTGAYFLDARGYRPEQSAATLPCPVLVLQGARDYQVTVAEDFEAWRRALSSNARDTLKVYPALDHRFVAGEGRSSPSQYEQPGHVDAHVVDEVAAWVRSLPPVP